MSSKVLYLNKQLNDKDFAMKKANDLKDQMRKEMDQMVKGMQLKDSKMVNFQKELQTTSEDITVVQNELMQAKEELMARDEKL